MKNVPQSSGSPKNNELKYSAPHPVEKARLLIVPQPFGLKKFLESPSSGIEDSRKSSDSQIPPPET